MVREMNLTPIFYLLTFQNQIKKHSYINGLQQGYLKCHSIIWFRTVNGGCALNEA